MTRARWRWAGVLVSSGTTLLAIALGLLGPATTVDRPGSGPVAEAPAAVVAGEASVLQARKAAPGPRRLSIPAIDVSTPLVHLGLQDDGTVEVPSDPDRAGWFDQGPVPGREGSSVLLGHVDSVTGPAVFARLPELRRGAVIDVGLTGGRAVRFTVRAVQTYANADFPAEKVYADHGHRSLNLVTCGGYYDVARGGYQSNVVVFARLG